MENSNTNPWKAFFGESKLKDKSQQDVDIATFSSKAGVMLYFSAHWCPPCRGFTPLLAKYYETHKEKFNFEIVFISSDKDANAFNEYWGEMPWLALPFEDRAKKEELAKKYKVSGIPSLIVLNSNAGLITAGGRGKVTSSPEEFPWLPKSLSQIFTGNVVNGKGQHIDIESLKSNTAIGFYFSAHWCPPCKAFTPQLVKTYNTLKEAGKKFEIIFASSDNDEESFKEYFNEMPWLAFPYGDKEDKRIAELSEHYEIEGIPMFILIDPATGTTINKSGRGAVGGDPLGAEFPWYPKALNSIESGGGDLNDFPSLIYVDKDLSDDTLAILKKVSTEYVEKWKAEKKDPLPMCFFYGKDGSIAVKVKEFANFKTDAFLMILDIPSVRKFVYELSGKPTEEDLRKLVDGFFNNTLTKKGIKDE